MKDILALVVIMLWPVIPIHWVPVHVATNFFKRLGKLTFVITVSIWASVAYLIFQHSWFLLAYRTEFSAIATVIGVILLAAGMILNIWTLALLTVPGIVGMPEISTRKSRLLNTGPFTVVRHPTYLAHAIMLFGVYLITGVVSVGILTVADIVIVNSVIIPLEERELIRRIGEPYGKYMTKVPRFFPRLRRKH